MRSRALVWIGLLGTAAGCSSDRAYLTLPPLEGARSMVLMLNGASPVVFDLTAGPAESTWSRAELPVLDAWVYERGLEALGLRAGPLSTDADGVALTPADAAFRVDLGSSETAWTRASTTSGPLAALRLPRPDHCRKFETETILVEPGSAGPVAAAPYPGGRLLVGASNDRVWLVSETGSTRLSVVGSTGFYTSGLGTLADGTMYLSSSTGALARGTLTGTVVHLTPIGRAPTSARQIAAGPSDELFVVTVDPDTGASAFGHLDGGSYVQLSDFPPSPTQDIRGGVVSLGPGRAIAGRVSSPEVIVYDHGAVTREQPGDQMEMISAIGEGPAGSVLVGTTRGAVIERRDGHWARLFSFDSEEAINAVIPFEDGLVFGTIAGHVGYYSRALGLCRSELPPMPNRPSIVVPTASGGWMFSGARPFGAGPSQIGVYHLLP